MQMLYKIVASLSLIGLLWGCAILVTTLQPWTYQAYLPSLSAYDPSQLGEKAIWENYQAMVDYGLYPGSEPTLEFQGIGMSSQGRQHFKEVRAVFQIILKATLICLFLFLATLRALRRQNGLASPLLWGPIGALVFPGLVGLMMLVDFNRAFTLFHQVIFRNSYWIFDPAQDPIIEYLPQAFFQSMAFIILLVLLTLCLLSLALYAKAKH
ncbi:MAG: TIGR01906 family membrane protein [Eubacteriales bacterium]|nr:TIGR01906 family membrane protein [Clostridiales bacterium]MDY5836263.1 TIGR01906 family membrane protein [Eubacteriales bacterium]